MKPLTIEEIKNLDVGDWVWVKNLTRNDYSLYAKKLETLSGDFLLCDYVYGHFYPQERYGATWLAYKNKEEAESKREIVKLPCKVGDAVYVVYLDDDDEFKIAETQCIGFNIREDGVEIITGFCCYAPYRYGKFTDKSQAEARLKELQEEL